MPMTSTAATAWEVHETDDDNNTRPRPIIVKFRSYETRRRVFSAKRKLKGSKVVVTENLTKRRSELYKKVRALSNVQCAWTIDGRIVCLPDNGRKETILHERDIPSLSRM